MPGRNLPYLEQARAEMPDRTEVRPALGIARYRTGAWRAAADVLDDVVAEEPRSADARLFLAVVRGLDIHPRVGAQLDRVLPLLRPGLDEVVRALIAADLDDTYEWTREVQAARRRARAPLESAWSLVWDHDAAPYALYRQPLPAP